MKSDPNAAAAVPTVVGAPTVWTSKDGYRVEIPPYCNRREGCEIIKRVLGIKVSARSVERWGVPVRIVNGQATPKTADMLNYAERLIESAVPTAPARLPASASGIALGAALLGRGGKITL